MTRRRVLLAGMLCASAALSGCTSLGGNVKGDFACRAPDGICAPSSMIDDRALALISGDEGDRNIAPAGPYIEPPREGRGFQQASAPVRTRERVLRIVFPAQIDAEGRLHEQSAIHAVVERGEWAETLAGSAVATSPQEVAAAAGRDTLLAAVERAEPPMIETLPVDPDLPSADAVALARAQGNGGEIQASDPVGDIKDQVARTLTSPRGDRRAKSPVKPGEPQNQARRRPVAQAPGTPPAPATPITSASQTPAAKSGEVNGVASSGQMISVPKFATAEGKAAIASVAADPAIRAGLGRAEPEAKAAAKEANPLPVIRASSFPGVQP